MIGGTTKARRIKRGLRVQRRDDFLTVRLERKLAERLRLAAWDADISRSDKVRRILDAALPQSP